MCCKGLQVKKTFCRSWQILSWKKPHLISQGFGLSLAQFAFENRWLMVDGDPILYHIPPNGRVQHCTYAVQHCGPFRLADLFHSQFFEACRRSQLTLANILHWHDSWFLHTHTHLPLFQSRGFPGFVGPYSSRNYNPSSKCWLESVLCHPSNI